MGEWFRRFLLPWRVCYFRCSIMAFRPLTARAPAVLLREAKPLKAILGHAQRLAHLQRLLESQLQPAARTHCHVAKWREGQLTLVVTDGHWATRLRYQQKRLQRQLQLFEELANLTRILFRVQPPLVQHRPGGHSMDLSPDAAQTIQSTAEGISDPGLRAALERLAAHAKDKT
ncbi:putative RNA-binding protein [Pseudomonas sp. IT-P260]